jgi:hypothetical protein
MASPGGTIQSTSSVLVPRSSFDYHLFSGTGAPPAMTTKLDKTLKREIDIDGQPYTVTISPEGVKLTQKGFRKGREMSWRSLWQGGTEEGSGGMSG